MVGQRITIDREAFSAAEVEAITGISQIVLRDWRRRKFLKTKIVSNRALYYAYDLGYLMALQALTSQGVAVGTATMAAGTAGPMIEHFAEAVSVPPADAPLVGFHGNRTARFLIVAQDGEIVRAGFLEDWVKMRDECGKAASAIVIDCKALGEQIAQKAPRPVVSVKRESE
ncbi:MerR family transcriptional regulator [Ancylobacter sp. SL191]|uniref:MerR family transcriptional regulator n=1 Tax=Ancylobacter sp. SL191 TaxID=2995166 RepID=UPI00226F9DFC|nr:MerR family transcriptional regulator [Ancylobacter sp. SL191]WAC29250.1 MerR family transcriptional regulator [Ancylobacter sp. SL191]